MTHPAFDLLRRGFHLMPMPAGSKLPRANDWQHSPAATPEQGVGYWGGEQPANVGVLTGAPSSIFVLDVDVKDGAAGLQSLRDLAGEAGMPPTLVVRTATGGWHFYFAMPGFEVRNSASKLAPGLDIRGTGGYVVGPGSWTSDGWYTVARPDEVGQAPAWLVDWLYAQHAARERAADAGAAAASAATYDPERAGDYAAYETSAVNRELDRLRSLVRPWQQGAGWDITTFEVACSLLEIAHADWSALTPPDVEALLLEHAPRDGAWGEDMILAKLASARTRVGGRARPTPALRPKVDDPWRIDPDNPYANSMVTTGQTGPVAAPSSEVSTFHDGAVDVSNPANAVEWLRENLGRGALSGIFMRSGQVVFTPRIGQEGYIEPRLGQTDETASISALDQYSLAARIQGRYAVTKTSEVDDGAGGKRRITSPTLFPPPAARHAIEAPDDMHGLRELRGVVHSPTFRADGSLISRPGYDEQTGLLFLPTGGQPQHAIPEHPSAQDVQTARAWLDHMLQDFAFVGPDDKANYLGLMLTPLIRSMVPAPYKLGVIEAHQPGSGKTFLARALTTVHGGIMHSEMPAEEAELIKTITSILDTSTGAVAVFDNVSGIVRSSALAGLLTSPFFHGRRLGVSKLVDVPNDRVWVITANNAVLGGDLARRSLRVRIDPGVPNPEARTQFAIADFETWVRENRGVLLWSLIVLIRAWVVAGSPVPDEIRGDSYGKWAAVVGGILGTASVPGIFDDPSAAAENVDPESAEWEEFLSAAYAVLGERPWSAKELMGLVAPPVEGFTPTETKPIPFDLLPGSLLSGKQVLAPTSLARAFGNHLRFRQGRWFGAFQFIASGTVGSRTRSTNWVIRRHHG